jgi:hypothetical protein
MAVAQITTSSLDKLFLEYILPGLNMELRENTILYDRFDTVDDVGVGKYSVFKCITGFATSARPSSSSTLPTSRPGTYSDFTLRQKRGMYAQLQFDGLAIACGKGKGAVMELVKAETENIMTYIANRMNKQLWGDGSGRLATLDAASSNSVTVSIDYRYFGTDSNGYTPANTFIEEGQDIDIIHQTSGVIEAEEVQISTIVEETDGTSTLTMATRVTATDNSEIFDHDTYAASDVAGTGVPNGLRGIISTANQTIGITATDYFQGQDRDTATWAQAQEVNMGSAAVSNAKMLETTHKVERYGRVAVIITNDVIWRAYYQILEQDKTLPNEPMMWGGVEGLGFYGGRKGKIPIIFDTDCPDGDMYFIDENHIKIHAPSKNGMAWIPGDAGILTRVQGKDEHSCALAHYYNMGTKKPRALARLKSIKHAAS